MLQTIPDIDQISAAMILIEFGDDLSAFAYAQYLVSWAALCPGNHAIRYLLCKAANAS